MTKTILILAANPLDMEPLRLDEEVREIENGLERSQKREEFVIRQKWAIRPTDVRRAMLGYKPYIVHFCGHGSGEEGIAFEDSRGRAKLVEANTLAEFFSLFADSVTCVLLNACFSEAQATAIAEHIPYVVGMKRAIGDASAIDFAVAFYDALGAGESFEFAYKLACNAIRWTSPVEHSIPSLFNLKKGIKPAFIGEEDEERVVGGIVLPPAVARPFNLSFEKPGEGQFPLGWFNSWGFVDFVSTQYISRIVPRPEGEGGHCVDFSNPWANPDEFGSLMQRCPVSSAAGKMIRLEAEVSTEKIDQWAGLWVRADAADGLNLFFDNMSDRPIRGSTPWRRYSIEALIPRDAK